MISISPSRLCRKAVLARLSNVSTGFNANLVTASTALGIPAFTINFDPVGTQNFYEARLDLNSIQESGYDAAQVMTLWAANATPSPDGQRLISHTFSGNVQAGIDVLLQYIQSGPLQDFETPADAVEQAMLATINTPNNQADFQGCMYDGMMSVDRPPVQFGGENWVQAVRFLLTFTPQLQ